MAVKRLPTKQALLEAMEVGETSIEAAEYMATRFAEILTEAKLLPQCQDMLDKINEYAQYVRFKLLSAAQAWSGEARPTSELQNVQENKARFLASNTQDLPAGLKVEIQIGDDARILRGYSPKADQDQLKTLDGLLDGWLAKNDLAVSGGKVVKTDAAGNKVEINPEEIRNLINDSEKGVAKYFEDKGVSIGVIQRTYGPQETKREEVRRAIEAGTEAEVPTTPSAR
ncbi:type IV secretion protein Dot [Legionella norrlandica]|uniref:Type IV secretion protein Dot n=1 Tax=Legionella norrlandica TaxID=1498499 RepID=A0A0A2SUH2_9GAMM|nr:hypothetical protein [Legionella norrlandica]KGP63094.1 type IV secretion protein Dot [Legionella norrlandica]